MANNEHAGHRKRMRKKFIENGIDVFEPHETLEMLLFYAVPMKNTSILAHQLINHFGSFSSVLDAPIDALISFGLTETQAAYLKLMPETARLYLDDKHNNPNKIITDENINEYMINKFIGRIDENVLLLLLDAKNKELFCSVINKGSINASQICVSKVVDLAMRYHARSAIIAHNHPSGIALPSKQDIETTNAIKTALEVVGIKLLDHIIVADNDCVSLAQSELL